MSAGVGNSDTQTPLFLLCNIVHLLLHRMKLPLNINSITVKHFSRIGELQRHMTNQKRTANLLFQSRNMGT